MRDRNLQKSFEALHAMKDAHRRARMFEELLVQLFLCAGHQACHNPHGAAPRQSDIFLETSRFDCIIEAKWMHRPVDSGHVDALRSRLDRMPSDVVGCIFSMSGFTRSAIHEVRNRRNREIILFDPIELHSLFHGTKSFTDLAESKRRALRIDGKVLLHDSRHAPTKGLPRLPRPDESFSPVTLSTHTLTCQATEYTHLVFARQYLEVEPLLGRASVLRLPLGCQTVAELGQVLGNVHNLFQLSAHGSFSIQQTGRYWHGLGAGAFLESAAKWRSRYRKIGLTKPHHTEQLAFVDKCSSVVFVLTANQNVFCQPKPIMMAELTVLLPGAPVNPEPFQRLLRATGNRGAFFETLEKTPDEVVRLKEPIVLEPVAEIHEHKAMGDVRFVTGIVAKNPYFRKHPQLNEGGRSYSAFSLLRATELIICELPSWYGVGDKVDRLRLTEIKATHFGDVVAFLPICRWGKIVREVHHPAPKRDRREHLRRILAKFKNSEDIAKRTDSLAKGR